MKHLTHTDLKYLLSLAQSLTGEVSKGLSQSVNNQNEGGKIDPSYMREKLTKIENLIK